MFAVIGVAAQLPSGTHSATDLDYEEFWNFLLNGNQAMENINELKLQPNPFEFADLSKLPQKGIFLKTMAEFDFSAFGLSGADAQVMPNSARRLMELSFHALRDAGIQTRGEPIGCFMSGNNDLDLDAMNTDGTLAYIPSAIANRVSYAFNLTGPSLTVDTACSSSLTGLHLAISAIENGDCTAALVGAAQSNRKLTEWWRYDNAHVLSPSGVGKPFDDEADGFTRGEGGVVVVVKGLQEALKDRDHIYCVVAGSFHNATGSQLPAYVPNGVAQQVCISKAYARAGRTPLEADYVELHMTGTKVGDPIEVNAASQAFCKEGSKVQVGSVKGNVGHLESAAFLASLIKACHIFDKGIIPPTPNFSVPNRSISWDELGLDVVTKPTPLRRNDNGKAPLISIASAGIGGSTGHVVLEGPPTPNFDGSPKPSQAAPVLFLIGGLTPKAVQDISRQIAHLPDDYEARLENAVYASRQVRQLPWRSFLLLKNGASFEVDIPRPILTPPTTPKLAFAFSGQGPHNAQMGHQLFQQYPIFRSTVLELDETHRRVMGYSFLDATGIFSKEIKDSRILQKKWPVILTLPALVMVHIGIFELVKSMGIRPDYLLGHSAGETALIYASGAGSKAMAMEVALVRGLAMTCTESMDAGMAVVGCGAADCQTLIDGIHRKLGVESDLEISCFNTPDSVVVSGKRELIERVIDLARGQGTFAQGIHTLVPGHCKYIEHCREEHYRLMQDIFLRYPGPHVPAVPVFSTCRPGKFVDEFTPDYFWDNARNPVYFSNAISRVLTQNDSDILFVEISPHPVLSGAIAAHGVPANRIVCPMQRFSREVYDPYHEASFLLSSAAQLSMAGYDRLDLSGFYGIHKHRKPLFNHPLQRSQVPPFKTFALGVNQEIKPLLSSLPLLNTDAVGLFSQHQVENMPVVPATGWIEMVLEAGNRCLWDIKFESLFPLQHGSHPALHFEREGRYRWVITSTQAALSAQHTSTRTVLATGSCRDKLSYKPPVENLDAAALWAKLGALSLKDLHEVHGRSLSFGRSFTRLLRVHGNSSEILAEVRGLSEEERAAGYIFHPALLDACIRVVAHKEFLQDWETTPWFPERIGKLFLFNNLDNSASLLSYARLKRWTPDTRVYDILVTSDQGRLMCELKDFSLRKTATGVSKQISALTLITEPVYVPSTIVSEPRFFQVQNEQAYEQLFRVMDTLALRKLHQTLERRLPCGNSADRVRYLEKLTRLDQSKIVSPTLEESELHEQELRWPAFFEVTRRIEEVHESVLQSSQAAISTLYADNLMTEYYAEHNQLTEACQEMAQQLDAILRVLRGSGKRSVQILEIGAGTGTLTRHLVPVLGDHPELAIEYTVTDASYTLVVDLAQSLRSGRLAPKAYDITKDPFAQGLSPESFDIIIAYHVLHVVPDLRVFAQRLHDILIPGGFLLATEVDNTSWSSKPGSIWMDFTFGSFTEWFNYQDGRDHCSMSPEQWNDLLRTAGFKNFSSITGSGQSLDFIFSCQAPASTERVVLKSPKFTLFQYRAGQELKLQQHLKTFNSSADGILCLWTDNERDSGPAVGLVLTLVKEFPVWEIWLAIFINPLDVERVGSIVKQNHLRLSRERLVYFSAEEAPLLPRVVRLPAAPLETRMQVASTLPNDHLIVQAMEHSSEGGFIGRVIQSSDPEIPEHSVVAGLVTEVTPKKVFQIHSGSAIQATRPDARVLPYLPAMVLQFHILGFSRLLYPARSYPFLRVLVSLHNPELQKALQHLLELSPGVKVLTEAPKAFVDVAVMDHDTLEKHPVFEQSVGTNGRLIVWSSRLLEQTVVQEPWIWRDILSTGIHNLDLPPADSVSRHEPGPTTFVPKSQGQNVLFDPKKAYVAIGGVGGIGIHLAVWLYKNGARHIYLTSRRGVETVLQAEDTTLLYKLQYLESQEDLKLKLVACDGANANEMAAFLKSIELPIGGCFFMPLALHDALFLQQTQDTIDIVRRPKIEAFDILSNLSDVNAMDFLVAFSSVTALWGNVGQSNYASACTALSGKISKYPKAFTLLVPPILDTGYLLQGEVFDRMNFQGSREWGIGVEELCEYIGDGIIRVKSDTNPSLYIPNLDLGIVTKYVPLPPMYHSLIPRAPLNDERGQGSAPTRQQVGDDQVHDVLKSAQEVVTSSLGIDKDTLSPDNPFINCGLDSIRATRLSRQLKPYIEVSQTDLLLWMTWDKLKQKIERKYTKNAEMPKSTEACQQLIISALGVNTADSSDVLFVNLGLGPVQAKQLSEQLKPYIKISHLELLATCWRDLELRLLQGNTTTKQPGSVGFATIDECRDLVKDSLGIEDLDPDIPFLSYGLDSIRATRLSRQLKPYVEVSYMNLLYGATWKTLEENIRGSITSKTEAPTASAPKQAEWTVSFTKLDEATRDGPVIFALPGITGTLSTTSPLMNHAEKGAATIWAAHFDLSACSHSPPSLEELTNAIFEGIRERHPSGDLRIISVSGSSTMALLLTRSLEAEGRHVVDVSCLDHFPALFCHGTYRLGAYMTSPEQSPEILQALDDVAERGVEIMLEMLEIDPSIAKQPSLGSDVSREEALKSLETARLMGVITVKFIKDMYYQSRGLSFERYEETLVKWMCSVKAQILVVVADRGFNLVVEAPWVDMGADKMLEYKSNVEVLHLDEGHFTVVGCKALAQRLSL